MSTAAKTAPPPRPNVAAKVAIAALMGLSLIGCSLFLIAGYVARIAQRPGFFGTRASLFADINLVAQIILLVGLLVGYGFARRGNITAHQYNQTFWVLFNIVLVMFIMLVSFVRQVVPGIPARLLRAYYFTSLVHSLLGGLTILLAVYILLRMNKLLPKALRIKGWKNLMRLTLGLYWLVGLFGIATYYFWYVQAREVSGAPEDAGVAEAGTVVVPIANYAYNPGTLEIPVGTTVIFRNADPDPHTVTSDTGYFPEGVVQEQEEYSFTFNEVGEFLYFCLYHGAAGGVGMAGVVRVGEVAEVAQVPTAVAPPPPTPQPTPAEPPVEALGPQSVGFGAFRDAEGRNNAFELALAGLPADPGGDLHAWLTGSGTPIHLGPVVNDGSGAARLTYVDPQGQNLLQNYSGFVVTLEPAGSAPTTPTGRVLLSSSLDPGVITPLQQLLVSSSDAPENTAYAPGLIVLTEELFRHAKAVNGAALVGDFDGMNRHIEHMLTLIQGAGGADYRDFDNDGTIQDPGDGFGILRYADAVAAQARLAASAPGASENVQVQAANLAVLAENMRTWGTRAVDLVILAHQGTTAAAQQTNAAEALAVTQNMLDGVDVDGDGLIEAAAGEGGAYTTYFYSQYLAALGAVPEPDSGIATAAPPTPTSQASPTAPAATATATTAGPAATATGNPPATATAAAAQPTTAAATAAPVFITYRNIEIVPAQTTVKVGTTVVFLVQGSLHQPYNFDAPNVFEAPNNLGDGTTFTYTFNEVGTTTIRCGYHANMLATVNVTP